MAASDFEVTVGADLTAYNAGLARGVRTASTASTAITRSLGQAAAASTAMGGAVATGANQAGNALTNLSRVAQDAPFGFIGIQNNLNPLLESFQRLRAETGSNMGALRALGQSLMGPAGVGIALAVVSSALTFYTMWQQKAAKATKETVVATNALNDVYKESNKEIAEETTQLKYLYASATDVTNAMDERLQSAKKLQEEYPKTFGLQEKENIINGEAIGIYNSLTAEIVRNARAKAAANKISDEAAKILDAELKKQKIAGQNLKEVAELETKRQELLSKYNAQAGVDGANRVVGAYTALAAAEAKQIEESNKRRQEAFNEQNKLILTAQKNIAAVEKLVGGAAAIGNGINDAVGDKRDKVAKPTEHKVLPLLENVGATNPDPFDYESKGFLKHMEEWRRAKQAQVDLMNVTGDASERLAHQQEVVGSLSNAFGTSLMGAFQSVLSGTQGFVSAMGQFLGQLISRLIAAAAAAAVLAVILGAVGFGGGLGGAASSFGSFKNLFGSFSGVKLAEGGITTGPTRALIGEGREKEAVMPLSKLQNFVNTNGGNGLKNGMVVGVLRGPDQLLQIQRAQHQKGRIG